MLRVKMRSIICFFIIFLVSFGVVISAQEQQKQEVTEEFFYTEEEELVEIASLRAQRLEEAPGIVSVITAQQIKDMGARDLSDILRMLPGFQMPLASVWFAPTYTIRGLKQEQNTRVLIMLDGVPLNEPYFGQSNAEWSDMPLNNVKRIEINRGSGYVLFGSYAFLAVINIITKDASDIDGIEISAGGGSWNTQQHYLAAGKKIGDFSFSGYVDYRKSDGYDNYFIQQDVVSLLYSYVPFLPSASKAPGYIKNPLDSKLFNAQVGYRNFKFKFKAQDHEKGMPFAAYSVTDGFFLGFKSYIAQAEYGLDISNNLALTLKANYYYVNHNPHGQAYPSGIFGPLLPGFNAQGFFPNGVIGDLTIKDKNYSIQSKFDYTLNDKNTLAFGVEYGHYKTDKPLILSNINVDPITRMQSNQLMETRGTTFGFMDREADRRVIAAFVQDSWQVTEKLDMTLGMRIDNYTEFGSTINPRFSLVWKLAKDTNFKLLYGHAFRTPTFNELYVISSTVTGNENLTPEKGRCFEIGINHRLSPRINANINYFYNALSDVILPTGPIIEATYPPQLENSGRINTQGFEAEVKANFKNNTYTYFNYSYAKATDELTGEVMPYVANNLFNFGLNLGMWKYLNANVNVNYVGERKRAALDPRPALDAYLLIDLTLRAQNFWKNTEFIVSVHNLFDTEYTDPEERGIIYYDFPREGKQILGKVIFKF